jgi:hypothetical protein
MVNGCNTDIGLSIIVIVIATIYYTKNKLTLYLIPHIPLTISYNVYLVPYINHNTILYYIVPHTLYTQHYIVYFAFTSYIL